MCVFCVFVFVYVRADLFTRSLCVLVTKAAFKYYIIQDCNFSRAVLKFLSDRKYCAISVKCSMYFFGQNAA